MSDMIRKASVPSRMPRPGEDPVDWMFLTGQMSEDLYRIVRPEASTKVLAAGRAERDRPEPPVAPVMRATKSGPAYEMNPLVGQVRATSASLYRHSTEAGPAPTMFAAGDLPAETRSGMDPRRLLDAPWTARHAIADAPTQAEAAELLELVSGPDGADNARAFDLDRHPGLKDYRSRVEVWTRDGVSHEAETQREALNERMVAASAGNPAMTVDQQVEALLAADEARIEQQRRREEDVILSGRAVGHARSAADIHRARQVRAAQQQNR